jgi:hypothetical protein
MFSLPFTEHSEYLTIFTYRTSKFPCILQSIYVEMLFETDWKFRLQITRFKIIANANNTPCDYGNTYPALLLMDLYATHTCMADCRDIGV